MPFLTVNPISSQRNILGDCLLNCWLDRSRRILQTSEELKVPGFCSSCGYQISDSGYLQTAQEIEYT